MIQQRFRHEKTGFPIVSVLMTTYNREQFLAEAIESVLESSFTDFELVIVDDGSSDNTIKIARDYEARDDRIKVFVNDKNLGDYPNRNRAISLARGEYIYFVDSDDKIFPQAIEKTISFMLLHPGLSFGMGSVGENSFEKSPQIISSNAAISKHFFSFPLLAIGPGGTVSKRTLHNSIGNYPTKYGPSNDMYFNLEVATQNSIVLFPFEFVFYRRHEGQEINNKYSYLINNYRYLRDALAELPLPLNRKEITWVDKKNKRRFTVNIVKYFFTTFNFRETRNAIQKAGFSFSDALNGIFH